MAEKYQNTYRTQTARASWHNYDGGMYFITICTQDRVHYFGEIENHEMHLSPIGRCAQLCWENIPTHFPHVKISKYVVMPNHIHGILAINDPHKDYKTLSSERSHNTFGPQSLNLASVIRGFKIGVTAFAKKSGLPFKWQARFHDHVIRNLDDWNRIVTYIENNVGQWDMDEMNTSMENP